MALSVFMYGSRRLPILNTAVSKLLTTQLKNSQLMITPIIAKNFSGFNRQIEEAKKVNNTQFIQHRMISHSVLWTAEKFLSVGLLAIIPGCIAVGGQVCDNILAVTVVLHMHWGIESVVVDYIRPSLVGSVISSIAHGFVYVMTAFTIGGLLYFNYNDIGLSNAIKRLWAIKASAKQED